MKNKFLYIFAVFILFSCIFITSNVFAVEGDNSVSDEIISKAESIANTKDFIIFKEQGGQEWLGVFEENTIRFYKDTNTSEYYTILSNGNRGIIKSYKLRGDNNFYFDVDNTLLLDIFTFQYSTIDIMYDREGSEIFFQKTPVVVETPETPEITTPEVEIPALETVEQIPEAMKETMKVVIPVGLVILGIGLVVYLIKFVKSRML